MQRVYGDDDEDMHSLIKLFMTIHMFKMLTLIMSPL